VLCAQDCCKVCRHTQLFRHDGTSKVCSLAFYADAPAAGSGFCNTASV
jgi:hypothetical protein